MSRPEYPDGPYACGECREPPAPCARCRTEWSEHVDDAAHARGANMLASETDRLRRLAEEG